MKLLFLFFLCALYLPLQVKSQINLDSLENKINATKDSPDKVDALNKLSWEYEFDNPDKALTIINSAYVISKKINYKKGLAQCLNDMGVCYSLQGKIEKSLDFYIQSLKIKESIHDERGVGISYINIGQVYSDQGQYDKGLEYLSKALTQFEKIHNEIEIAATYNSIGTLYDKMQKYDSALMYIERSYDLRKRINDADGISECVGNLAAVYKHLGDYNKAIEYYEMDMKLNDLEGNDYSKTITMNNMSLLYADLNNLDMAISTAEKSAEISEKKGFLENLKFALGNLADFYRTKKDYAQAYHYLATYFSVCDSLKNQDLSRSLNDLSIKYETEKKEQQNQLLKTQNDLSEKTIKQQRIVTFFVIICLCLVSLLAFFIFRGLKKQRHANRLILHQKHIIEEKHKEITDSIHYAQRIQKALITSEKYIDKQLNKLNKNN
jgi:tetratricopeptide (TPR) repeat protein